MDSDKILKLVRDIRKVCINNYDQLKYEVDGINHKVMISFFYPPGKTRKINDWGWDEDTDYVVGISENGWEIYETVEEVGAGPTTVISTLSTELTDEIIVNMIENGRLMDYIDFFAKVKKIVDDYKSDFGLELY